MTSRLRLLVVAATLSIASIANAEVELKNDGFVSGASASFQTGFVAGEAGASRFVAPEAGRKLLKLQLLFGGASTIQTVTFKVYDDTLGTDIPGGELFTGDLDLMGSDTAMQELDISVSNVIVPAQFRVAAVFQHAAAPSIASDGDGNIGATKNFLLTTGGTWRKSSELGLTGDWVIRAFISDATGPDLGVFCDANADCSNGQYCDVPHHACVTGCRDSSECSSGTCNANQCTGPSEDDGGCRTGGESGSGGAAFAFGSLALLVASRRFGKAGR